MSGVLLDTNIVSEIMKPEPTPQVVDWLQGLELGYLSVVTIHELDYGLALLPKGKRRSALEVMIAGLLSDYADQIIAIGPDEARQAAELRLKAHHQGWVLHLADAFIGATAQAHGLHLATRNAGDFEGLGLELVNPWN